MAATPKVPTGRTADAFEVIVGTGALLAPTLAARVGRPPFAPQLVVLHNSSDTAEATGCIVVDDDTGVAQPAFIIHRGDTVTLPTAIRNVNVPAAVMIFAYWWERGGTPPNQYTVAARNP